MSGDANEVVELWKGQAAYRVSLQELLTELTRFKAESVQATAEKLELSTKPGAVTAESDMRLEELAGARFACDRVERLVRSVVDQSARALHAFVNQVAA